MCARGISEAPNLPAAPPQAQTGSSQISAIPSQISPLDALAGASDSGMP